VLYLALRGRSIGNSEKLMKITLLLLLLALAPSAQAATMNTQVNTVDRKVTVDFTDLLPYTQISLTGVTGIYFRSGQDPLNPTWLGTNGAFKVNGDVLEITYEGALGPSPNTITYHYRDGYEFVAFEPDTPWVEITLETEDKQTLTGDWPRVQLASAPEPPTAMLLLGGLAVLALIRPRSVRTSR